MVLLGHTILQLRNYMRTNPKRIILATALSTGAACHEHVSESCCCLLAVLREFMHI